jgi:hypothetical protein
VLQHKVLQFGGYTVQCPCSPAGKRKRAATWSVCSCPKRRRGSPTLQTTAYCLWPGELETAGTATHERRSKSHTHSIHVLLAGLLQAQGHT